LSVSRQLGAEEQISGWRVFRPETICALLVEGVVALVIDYWISDNDYEKWRASRRTR